MSQKRNIKLTILLVLSVSVIITALTTFSLTYYFCQQQYRTLENFCGAVIEKNPESEQAILEVLKAQEEKTLSLSNENVLSSFGYRKSDFLQFNGRFFWLSGISGLIGILLVLAAYLYWQKQSQTRINGLTEYLERINTGKQGVLLDTSEDAFSKLQDELYKTVTTLYQTRDEAVTAKRNFTDNLFNIAHQLKTPITAISLSTQMMKETIASDYLLQIEKQLDRLTYLEEALLLLARIDAGTLIMKKETVDIFTVLTLAADNLQELLQEKEVRIDIPEIDEISIQADLEWTMEAIMNLLKNCMEHAPQGTAIHCSYEKNPLYVQIQIWDEGAGFAKEDVPHLFERFYRGKNANSTGVGIGLSLAKEIIEMQNGVMSGFNRRQGGACFEIRFYSH